MPNGFSVKIEAVDRATKTLDSINKRIDAITKPVRRLQAAAKGFADRSGLSKVGRGFGAVARFAGDAVGTVTRMIGPLGAITSAASAAGMYRLVESWGDFGQKLSFAAQRIGISADKLQGLQGAARLAGASAEGLTSGMRTLTDTLTDAVGGRNAGAVVYFNTLGISFRDASGHARAASDVLPELADKIAAIKDPALQARAATALLGGSAEELLPFLRKGSAGLREYEEMARRYGVTSDEAAASAVAFKQSQTQLQLAVEGLSQSIGAKLAPVIGPLLTQMAEWIAANRDWIAQGIGDKVQEFATWLKSIDWNAVGSGVKALVQDVGGVVGVLGGWQTGLAAVTLAMSGPLIGAIEAVGAALAFLTATPIGLAITAVAALGAAGYELYEHWSDIKAQFERLWDGLKGLFEDNTGYIRTAAELLFPIPALIIGHWGKLQEFFSGMWDGIKSSFDAGWKYVEPILDRVKNAVDWVGDSWVGRHLGAAASTVESGIGSAASAVGGAVSSGAKGLAAGLDRVMGFSSSGGTSRPTTKEQDALGKQAIGYFMSQGWTKEQAAGIVGNLQQESGFGAKATGDNGAAYGIAQWHSDRQAAFKKQFGKDIHDASYADQLAFVNYELTEGSEKRAGAALHNATSAREAGAIVSAKYERPAAVVVEQQRRGDLAENWSRNFGTGAPALSSDDGKSVAAAAPGGSVTLDITHRNPPPGTTTRVASNGNVQVNGPRVERAMPGGQMP